MRRLFTAIKIKPAHKLVTAIEDFSRELSREKIKWINPENIHITLKFFGNTPESDIPAIKSSLLDASRGLCEFDVTVKGCGTFGSPRFPRVIWLGLENSDRLKTLYNKINYELSKVGVKPDERSFSPHLTIGRVKHIKNLYALDALVSKYHDETLLTQSVNSFQLFESVLQREGPKYLVLENFRI